MTPHSAEQYERWAAPFRRDGRLLALLVYGTKVETYLFYVLYPLLLVLLAVTGEWGQLVRSVMVPAVCFVLVSVVRSWVNAPRPYEELDIQPLIDKGTRGRSLPSRHVFSVYLIAMSWLAYCLPVGVVLLVLGIDMMALRVLGGVHYVRDVVCGALLGVACGVLGFWCLPWG